MLAPVSRCILGKNKAAWISTCGSPSFLLRERPPGVGFFFSEATASAADDTLRKPLSRLLCVTLTVMQTNRQTQTHGTHTLLLVEGLIFQHVENTDLCVTVSIWQKRKFFLGFTGHSCSRRLYDQLSQAHVHGGGESLLVSGSAPLCRPHRPRVKSLG